MDTSIVLDSSSEYDISRDWQCAYVFAFLWQFSSMAEEPFWPSTAQDFETALQESEAPLVPVDNLEAGIDNWKPSMQPILKYLQLALHPSSTQKSENDWLRKFVEERRMDSTTDILRNSGFYNVSTGNNILSGSKDFWSLSVKDRVRRVFEIHFSSLLRIR